MIMTGMLQGLQDKKEGGVLYIKIFSMTRVKQPREIFDKNKYWKERKKRTNKRNDKQEDVEFPLHTQHLYQISKS